MSIHQPPLEDLEAWRTFWQAQGQPWRREPEISVERQKFLASRRAIPVDVAHGVYPFKGNDIKLTRADVEWLLDTHESEGVRGPVDWNDVSSRYREGLDLRGADLRSIDLSDLPLARLRAGFDAAGVTLHYWRNATVEQREAAAVHLEGAKLCRAQLQEATLWRSHLNGANLEDARLEGANLSRTHFEGANLSGTRLEGADLTSAFFDNSSSLRDATLGNSEQGFVSVADARWSGINLALVRWPQRKWSKMLILGDERAARQPADTQSQKKESRVVINQMVVHRTRRDETSKPLIRYEVAVRANRQIAVALHEQGLNELSAHFAYRGELLQQQVLLRQRRIGKYLFSLLLNGLAGYGYRPMRSLVVYLLVIIGFAAGYYFIGPTVNIPLSLPAALVMSVSSFHGRGFFPGPKVALDSPVTELAALEALIGLLIEIIFIATFTQRFFNK